jgi:hypothetical protein
MIHIAVTTRPTNKTTVSQDIAEGLALAWNTPVLLSLFTVLGIVTFCTKPYTQFMPVFARDILQVGAPGLGLLLMAPGAGAILGGLTLLSIRRFPRPHYLHFFSRSRFWFLNYLLRRFAAFSAFHSFFYFSPAAFRPLFFPVATLLQIQSTETNRGRMMSLFGLINRGLGPMGSFPFGMGMVAAAIGAPWTVAICGFITVGMIAYLTFSRLDLRTAQPISEV